MTALTKIDDLLDNEISKYYNHRSAFTNDPQYIEAQQQADEAWGRIQEESIRQAQQGPLAALYAQVQTGKPKSITATMAAAKSQHKGALHQHYVDFEDAHTAMTIRAVDHAFANGFRAGFRFRCELENWAWGKPIPV